MRKPDHKGEAFDCIPTLGSIAPFVYHMTSCENRLKGVERPFKKNARLAGIFDLLHDPYKALNFVYLDHICTSGNTDWYSGRDYKHVLFLNMFSNFKHFNRAFEKLIDC